MSYWYLSELLDVPPLIVQWSYYIKLFLGSVFPFNSNKIMCKFLQLTGDFMQLDQSKVR